MDGTEAIAAYCGADMALNPAAPCLSAHVDRLPRPYHPGRGVETAAMRQALRACHALHFAFEHHKAFRVDVDTVLAETGRSERR